MSKRNSRGKEAVRESEETSKDLVSMNKGFFLIKYGTTTQGPKGRRGICMGSTRIDFESSKDKGGAENGSNSSTVSKIVTVATGVVEVVSLVADLISLFSGPGSDPEPEKKRKTMVAPGRGPNRVFRDDFTNNARGYFRGLHAEEKMKKKLNGKK